MRRLIWALALLLAGNAAMAQAVDPATFSKGIQQPGVQVFDVRTPAEFNTGHLTNALQADYTKKEEFNERVKYLDRQRPVYIYCLSGGRSNAAAKWMRDNGFREVVELDGGINAWKNAGQPLTGGGAPRPQMMIDTYQASIAKGWVLTDVGAAWCPPCRQQEPILEKFLAARKNITLVKVDGGNDTNVMKAISAKGLPTLILYKDGKEVWRKQGVATEAELEKALR
ncbi:redoxin family protein [Chitinophaga sp. Mgbs1]|uniref:Redoxin family protein n=1 Tax=Chitinophaga solisilvae TaxID=1233460 RepID=A0A433WN46_9BACT|nr:redoxin family protein [Chitinophaga solisilvae]